jgi:hypothetical protein
MPWHLLFVAMGLYRALLRVPRQAVYAMAFKNSADPAGRNLNAVISL